MVIDVFSQVLEVKSIAISYLFTTKLEILFTCFSEVFDDLVADSSVTRQRQTASSLVRKISQHESHNSI